LHVRGFFAKSQLKAGSVLVFGFVSLGVSVSAALFINLISMVLKLFKFYLTTPSFSIPLKSPLSAATMIIAIVIAGPVAEEFMFRGVMLSVLKKHGNAFAVICSSLIWALMHGNLIQAVPVFCMGLVFGVLALKADSIVPSILIHMANNLIALLGMLAKQSGNMYLMLALGAFNIMLFITAIPLFCVYYKQFFVSDNNKDEKLQKHIGAKAFFTSVPILLAIVIYSGYIITSVIPISLTF
jgi:membrane protease YdiL (CAAX protease family)